MRGLIVGSPHDQHEHDQQQVRQPRHEDLAARSAATWSIDAGVSPSSRMMVFGFHSFSTATITTMQVSELRMSVSSGPM